MEATAPAGLKMHGPTREHVEGDPYQDDPRVVTPFNGGSPSGEVEAEVVYANYARPEDFRKLKQMGIDVRGKVVIARYGQNFRGVKALTAQEAGAAALIIYSDPIDDGYFRATHTRRGHIALRPACSAAQCSSPSSIPETPPLRASPPRWIFRSRSDCHLKRQGIFQRFR